MNNSRGSIWRKWDLHIHTPASYQWNGQQFSMMSKREEEDCLNSILTTINESDVDVFCIMDYWTFDGYIKIRNFINKNPEKKNKTILPGIELRLDAPANFRLNSHVIFDNAISDDSLDLFLKTLRLSEPDGKPPTREGFVSIAKKFDGGKLRVFGYTPEDKSDDDKMHILGMKTGVVTKESLKKAIEIVGRKKCLIVQPYDTNDGIEGLDWKQQPYSDSTLMKMADIFETRNSVHVSLFLGRGHPDPEKSHVGKEFIDNLGGFPKPVVSGSDAHQISDYGQYPNNRITWLKAQPTFAGLRQICNEPSARCFIGKLPKKIDHVQLNPTKYMSQLVINKKEDSDLEEHWFDGVTIKLNNGLVAIIGNRGSGKSALADILALAGNAYCNEMEFLNKKRFRHGINRASHFNAVLEWNDDTPDKVMLDHDPKYDHPERVRYLPQQSIEKLCNEISEGDDTSFEKELKKVIFSHIPEDQRLKRASLDELLKYKIEGVNTAIVLLHNKLRSLNGEILHLEHETSKDTIKSYESELVVKQKELQSHEKTEPKKVSEPKEDQDDHETKKITSLLVQAETKLNELQIQRDKTKEEQTSLISREALLGRLQGYIDNYEKYHCDFVEEAEPEFKEAELDLSKIINFSLDRSTLNTTIKHVDVDLEKTKNIINGIEGKKGLNAQLSDVKEEIDVIKKELKAPQQNYQNYLAEKRRWEKRRDELIGFSDKPDTLDYIKSRLKNATEIAPKQHGILVIQRKQCVREIHAELLKIRNVFQDLYKPVQDIATENKLEKDSPQLVFDAFLSSTGFESRFFEFIL